MWQRLIDKYMAHKILEWLAAIALVCGLAWLAGQTTGYFYIMVGAHL